MLIDAIIINLNLKLININLPLWDCSKKSKILHVPAECAIWYGNFSPLVAGVMVVTQYHSADPPIVLCNNIWLSGL